MKKNTAGDEELIPEEKLQNGCPFCGNRELFVSYSEGTLPYYAEEGEDTEKREGTFVSVTSVCYDCHTRKYIALPEKGKVDREQMTERAVEAWERRADEQQ